MFAQPTVLMTRIRIVWLALFVLISGTYWFSLNTVETTPALWAWRKSLLYYSGVLAIGMMSIGMVLAMRLQSIESLLGGLDKHYRLHKWVGVSGVIFALIHWLVKLGPKWLVHHQWADAATFKTPADTVGFFDHADFLHPFRSFAKDLGEWAIYALIALALIALIKRFPYRTFFKAHRILPVVYLALALHSVVLFTKLGVNSPIGYLTAVLMLLGVAGAVASLRGKTGASHRSVGHLSRFESHPSDGVTEVYVALDDHWPGHKPGQFAFVTFDPKEGAHPFSLSSAWGDSHEVRFHIKQLGDYTRLLPKALTVGQTVIVQGPYGRFDFEPADAKQIWIAGGVGVTPFLSRLEALSQQTTIEANYSGNVHCYLCIRRTDSDLVRETQRLAALAHVKLSVVPSEQFESLTGARIRTENTDWQNREVWFCGPAGLGQAIRQDLLSSGFSSWRFHQELFDLR